MKPSVAVCKSCGAVLDREKALALGIVQGAALAAEKSGDSSASRATQRK